MNIKKICRPYVLLQRHAQSPQQGGIDDSARLLSAQGQQQAGEMGKRLQALRLWPTQDVLCSTAMRTRETLAWMEYCTGSTSAHTRYEDALYTPSVDELEQLASTRPPHLASRLVLSHNPGISLLASRWAQRDIRLKAGAVAVFIVRDDMTMRFVDVLLP